VVRRGRVIAERSQQRRELCAGQRPATLCAQRKLFPRIVHTTPSVECHCAILIYYIYTSRGLFFFH
jgi:hypothetical protein